MTSRTTSSKQPKRFFVYSHDEYDSPLMTLEEAKREIEKNFEGYNEGNGVMIFEAKFTAIKNGVEFKPV